ncbi:DoxX family protein [Aneurinibacillus tyrosinisolvens]|jgi:thiosulfate dehydrogenase (quinone) large subunit|uniref:DoxX family protein n=1 Tax=Aneurinibacillus tyrosinisolvens TaxID=1443435 RepID=UPI00063EFF75|nr:DoxX family protein [Aneurinibacillus tyrosinisolvens]
MLVKWVRENRMASGILTVFRLWLGYTWVTSGWEKLTGGFATMGFFKGALAKAAGDHPAVQGWWASFLEGVAMPNAKLFDFLIPWAEFLVGIALIAGLFTTFAALMGIMMNYAFLFSGTTSINPQLVLIATFILIAGRNAGYFGLDYYAMPLIDKWMHKEHKIRFTGPKSKAS